MAKTIKVKKGDTLSGIAAREGVGISDISGYRSGNPDLIFPDEVLNINTPSTGDTNLAGGNEDTGFDFGSSGLGDFSLNSEEDKALAQIIDDRRRQATGNIDEGSIRRKNLALFQDQINAVNEIYDSLVADERIAGTDRVGQGRAIQNRQGLIGSARGEKQRQNIVAKNQAAINAIQAERSAKISRILGEARASAVAEIEAERKAKQQSATEYLSFLGLQDERRSERVKTAMASLISQGYSLDDLAPDEFAELTDNLRVSGDVLRSTYAELTPEVKQEDGAFTLGRYDIRFDSEGNVIARGSASGGGSSSGSTPSGDEPVEVMTFEEFKATPEAAQIIDEAQNQAQQSFPQDRRDALLKAVYDEEVKALEQSTKRSTTVSTGDLTTGNTRDLTQAGLLNADQSTQSFFLNLPSKIRDEIQRGVASGIINSSDLTIEEMQKVLDEEDSSSSSSSSNEDPFNF